MQKDLCPFSHHTPLHVVLHFSSKAEGLADTDTRPVGEHAGCNVHRRQLLEEQLGRVRDVHLRDLGLVSAWSALERLCVEFAVITSVTYHSYSRSRYTYAIGVIRPQMSQTCTLNASETSNSLSFKNADAPCEIIQSRSISPKRRPPSLARPSTG